MFIYMLDGFDEFRRQPIPNTECFVSFDNIDEKILGYMKQDEKANRNVKRIITKNRLLN